MSMSDGEPALERVSMQRVFEDLKIGDNTCVFPRQLLHILSACYDKRLLLDSVGVFRRRQCCQLLLFHLSALGAVH
jgi:hypothetical protein